jgi:hypothetical protein
MTTINDLELNEHIREIHRASSRLDYLAREGNELELFFEIYNVEYAVDRARKRLRGLRLKRKEAA